MTSKFYSEESNGIVKTIYENSSYNFTVDSNGNANLEQKSQEPSMIIGQLEADLAATTLKVQTLMNVFKGCVEQGVLPTELIDKLSSYIYDPQSVELSKSSK